VLQSISYNTRKAYNCAYTLFENFCLLYNISLSHPIQSAQLSQFISYLSLKGYSAATIETYVAGIKHFQRYSFDSKLDTDYTTAKQLKGLRRSHSTPDTRAPITITQLKTILMALSSVCTSVYETLLFRSLFTVMYFAMLRISEVAADTNKGYSTRTLQFASTHIDNTHSVLHLYIPFSKTDQLGKGCAVVISSLRDSLLCPVYNMKNYLDHRISTAKPLFVHRNGTQLSRYQVNHVLKKVLIFCNISQVKLRSHSFRLGYASICGAMGVDHSRIKSWGRWKSSAYKKYIRVLQDS
jgi:site-specific recombinase XerD